MRIKNQGHLTKFLRCDNAGENIALLEVCDIYNVTPEMTSPHTPQENGVVERGFAIVRNRAIAMMNDLDLDKDIKGKLWAEALNTSTYLVNITACNPNKLESSHRKLLGEKAITLKHLKTFGCIGYVTNRLNKGKFDNKATKCYMIGYPQNHANYCYRMYNPDTKRVNFSRDIIWDEKEPAQIIEYEISKQPDNEREEFKLNEESGEARCGECDHDVEQIKSLIPKKRRHNTRNTEIPPTFETAVRDLKWKNAMINELSNIEQREVWEEIELTELPPNTKCFGTRWIYTVKEASKLKARLVVLGCYQRPGIDYTETFAPVASDATIRALLSTANYNGWEIHQIDVETAFLNAPLKETVYIKIPKGYKLASEAGQTHVFSL